MGLGNCNATAPLDALVRRNRGHFDLDALRSSASFDRTRHREIRRHSGRLTRNLKLLLLAARSKNSPSLY
eukprot:3666488-Pyramimonas_sp.AAC.1